MMYEHIFSLLLLNLNVPLQIGKYILGVHAGPSPGFSSRGGQKPEGGAKNQKEGPKTRRRATFLKYSIGCM